MLNKKPVEIVDGPTEISDEEIEKFSGMDFVNELMKHSPYGYSVDAVSCTVWVDLDRAPDVKPLDEIKVKVTLKRKSLSKNHYEYRFILPEGWTVSGDKMNITGSCVSEYTITAGERVDAKNKVILEVTRDGHCEYIYMPLVFFG